MTIPTPTINTSDNDYKIITYNIDLSGYKEFAPLLYVEGYCQYDWSVIFGHNGKVLYYKDMRYNYEWGGIMGITNSYIRLKTCLKSSNVGSNYFTLKKLFVR